LKAENEQLAFANGHLTQRLGDLDRESAGIFDVAENQWSTLDKTRVLAIEAVVEMAAKHRPMEVVALPLGAIVPEGGGIRSIPILPGKAPEPKAMVSATKIV